MIIFGNMVCGKLQDDASPTLGLDASEGDEDQPTDCVNSTVHEENFDLVYKTFHRTAARGTNLRRGLLAQGGAKMVS